MPDNFAPEEAAAACLMLRPGLTVFVGRRQGNRGRTDVMAGAHDVPYFRAISCVGADHWERASAYVAAYRVMSRTVNKNRRRVAAAAEDTPWDE